MRPFLRRVQTDRVREDDLRAQDQLVIAYLGSAESDPTRAEVLSRSWAAYQLGAIEEAETLAGRIATIGDHQLNAVGAPTWATEAALRAGVAIGVAARVATYIVSRAADEALPQTIDEWSDLTIDALGALPTTDLNLVLDPKNFRSTAIAGLWSPSAPTKAAGLAALRETVRTWLSGEPLAAVGGAAEGSARLTNSGRGERDPVPRTLRVIDNGIGFGLTRAAGLVAATVDVAGERGAIAQVPEGSRSALESLPIALRFGASDFIALALLRVGARPRAIATLLAARLPPPPEGLDDDGLRDWARGRLDRLEESLDEIAADESEMALLTAFVVARDAT